MHRQAAIIFQCAYPFCSSSSSFSSERWDAWYMTWTGKLPWCFSVHSLLLSLPKTTFLEVTTVRCLTTQIARLPCNVRVQTLLPTLESRPRHMRREGLVLHTHNPQVFRIWAYCPFLWCITRVFRSSITLGFSISFVHFVTFRVFHLSRSFVTLGFSISLVPASN